MRHPLRSPRGGLGARAFPALLALFVLAGCATPQKITYTPEEAREEVGQRVAGKQLGEVAVPFAISEELAEEAREATFGTLGEIGALRALVDMISDMQYDLGHTHDADRAFETRIGDCITATNLFVGMSRAVGLETYFVEAVGVEDVSAERGLNVHHRHVLAAHGMEPAVTLIDFNRIGAGYYRYRVLNDIEAMALFYNTKGYQALRASDDASAERLFRIAVALDPKLAWAHNNLGVALRRQERVGLAEASFRRAIDVDASYAASYRNLAQLLRTHGRPAEATELEASAEELDRRDPLRHYERGVDFAREGNHAEAIRALRHAVGLSPRFVRGWLELGRAYLAAGDGDRARRALERALELEPENLVAQRLMSGDAELADSDIPTIVDAFDKARRKYVATSKIEAPPPD
jgi:Flp pilus assembly protein TadD